MATVYNVGQLITELVPSIDKMRLYKLCFFSQGWHLAWTGMPLFNEELQAWTMGPVPKSLRDRSDRIADGWIVSFIPNGDSTTLSSYERSVVENVVAFYNAYSSEELSEISHGRAWLEARRGLPHDAQSEQPLSITTIREEFTDRIRSGEPAPTAPAEIFNNTDFNFEDMLETAIEIEKEWHRTFELLAKR